MKANYLSRNRTSHPYYKRILILVFIFIIGGIASYFFEGVAARIISPFWRLENYVFSSRKVLLAENNMLKERLLELERQNDKDTSLATVLSRPPQTPYDIIIVDASALSPLEPGLKVFLPEGLPIGVVSEVFGQQAKVELFSAPDKETPAILERHSVPVSLVGSGGGNFKIGVPRDVAVEIGDRILSTESELLAVVEDVILKPTDSFKEVLAKNPTNIFSLRFVLIKP